MKKKIGFSMNESTDGVVCTITVQADNLQEILPVVDSVIVALEREERNRRDESVETKRWDDEDYPKAPCWV